MTRMLILLVPAISFGCSKVSTEEPMPLSVETSAPLKSQAPTDTQPPYDAKTGNRQMREELIKFIQSPDRETYLAFREKVIASDVYDPYSDEVRTAGELFAENKFEEARGTIQQSIGNLILSPRAHEMLGLLHYKLGDEQAAQMEMVLARACIQGILATGDGSVDAPYIVLRTSDEHDVIEHLKKEFRQQSLSHQGEKHFDLIECTDGSKYWFDVTDAYDQLAKSLGE